MSVLRSRLQSGKYRRNTAWPSGLQSQPIVWIAGHAGRLLFQTFGQAGRLAAFYTDLSSRLNPSSALLERVVVPSTDTCNSSHCEACFALDPSSSSSATRLGDGDSRLFLGFGTNHGHSCPCFEALRHAPALHPPSPVRSACCVLPQSTCGASCSRLSSISTSAPT